MSRQQALQQAKMLLQQERKRRIGAVGAATKSALVSGAKSARAAVTSGAQASAGEILELGKAVKSGSILAQAFIVFTIISMLAMLTVWLLHYVPTWFVPPRKPVISYRAMFWTMVSISFAIWMFFTVSGGRTRLLMGLGVFALAVVGGAIAYLANGIITADWKLQALSVKLGLREAAEAWACAVDTQRFSVAMGRCVPAVGISDFALKDGWRLTYADEYTQVISKNFAGKNASVDFYNLFEGLARKISYAPSSAAAEGKTDKKEGTIGELFEKPISWNMLTLSSVGQPKIVIGEGGYDFPLDKAKASPDVWHKFEITNEKPLEADQLLQYRWSNKGTSGHGVGSFAQWRLYNMNPKQVFRTENGAVNVIEIRMPMVTSPEFRDACVGKQLEACEVGGFKKTAGCPCFVDQRTVGGLVVADAVRKSGVQYSCVNNSSHVKAMCSTLIDGVNETNTELTRDCAGSIKCIPLFPTSAPAK